MLNVERLTFSYGNGLVLKGLDLSVLAGEIVGLVGPNGSGKSTLLRLVSGVLSPQDGRVCLMDRDTRRLSPRARARLVAMVPQSPSVPEGFTALEMVLMGRTPHLKLLQWEGRGDFEVARKAMEMAQCWDMAYKALDALSGGERQRVFIARALAQEAPLLLLDEPTSNLDLAHQVAVLELVKHIQRERNGAVLMAIHDLTTAAQYCHRIALLHQGRVYANGAPKDVLNEENIRTAFGAEVFLLPHPIGGTPVVLPVFHDGEMKAKGPDDRG